MSDTNELMRELWEQERVERWQLYRDFRAEMDAYKQRMDDVVGDHYHKLDTDNIESSALVLGRVASVAGPYDYISVFERESPRSGVERRALRSFAVARHHYALRWIFFESRHYEGSDIAIEALDKGPTGASPYSPNRHDLRAHDNLRAMFAPEMYWTPKMFEREKVREVLTEAIGLISMLGYDEESVPKAEASPDLRESHRRI